MLSLWKKISMLKNYGSLKDSTFICENCAKKAGFNVGKVTDYFKLLKLTSSDVKKLIEPDKDVIALEDSLDEYYTLEEILQLPDDEFQKAFHEMYYIESPNINLQQNEICSYECKANRIITKNVSLGTERVSNYSGSYYKGIKVGTGHSITKNIKDTVIEKYPGSFFMTNQRIVLLSLEKGFEIPIHKVSSLDFSGQYVTLFSNGKSYTIEPDCIEDLRQFLEMNNEYERRKARNQIIPEEDKDISIHSEKDIPKLLRSYKELLDDGIITEEEFNKKKQSLLNL